MEYPEADSPESIPKLFVAAWNRRDAAKIAALFDEDAEFINVTGLWWHSREAIEKAHTYGLTTIFNESQLTLIRTKVKMLADNIAVVQAKMKLDGQTPVGHIQNPETRRNIFTFVVHKQGTEWRCASAHNTDIIPNKETNIHDEQGRIMPVDYRKKNREEE